MQALASDEVLIIGSIASDNIAVPYKDNTTIRFHEEAHTYSDMAHAGTSGIHDPYTQNISRPMVCWRVRAVPKTFVTDGPSGFGDVHYVCVTTLAVTGGVAPYPEPVQLAGALWLQILPVLGAQLLLGRHCWDSQQGELMCFVKTEFGTLPRRCRPRAGARAHSCQGPEHGGEQARGRRLHGLQREERQGHRGEGRRRIQQVDDARGQGAPAAVRPGVPTFHM